jgi:hypothetical protein
MTILQMFASDMETYGRLIQTKACISGLEGLAENAAGGCSEGETSPPDKKRVCELIKIYYMLPPLASFFLCSLRSIVQKKKLISAVSQFSILHYHAHTFCISLANSRRLVIKRINQHLLY